MLCSARLSGAARPARPPVFLALLSLLAGPAAVRAEGNFGTYTESIPIEVPAGPAAATPELALTYSSAAGNGNAGVGWGLQSSSIRLDLRRGVPQWHLPGEYSCSSMNAERDEKGWSGTVWLDGMELALLTRDAVWGSDRCIFGTAPDTFVAAVPFWPDGGGPGGPISDLDSQPSGWAVLKPDGTIWWYGDDPGEAEPVYRRSSVPAPGDFYNQEIVGEWMLHHVQNRDGNLVTWWPEVSEVSGSGANPGRESSEALLRYVSWGATLSFRGGAAPGTYAWSPSGSSITGFDDGFVYSGRGPTGHVGALLDDPGPFFPGAVESHYAVRIDWEERPDKRVSWLTGEKQVAAHRIARIAVASGIRPERVARDEVDVDGSARWLRTYVLQYDEGSTGKSRLRRVWDLPGQDPDSSLPAAIPASGRDDWDPTDLSLLVSPWEMNYTDSTILDPIGPTVPGRDDPRTTSTSEGLGHWLDESFAEGGASFGVLQDMTGDRMVDQIRHFSDGSGYDQLYNDLEDNVVAVLLPWTDNLQPFPSDDRFWLRPNLGDGWGEQQPGPIDPVALYATADAQVGLLPCGADDLNDLPVDVCAQQLIDANPLLPIDLPDEIEGVGLFCAMAGTGVFDHGPPAMSPVFSSPSPTPPAFFNPPGSFSQLKGAMAWCEYRSCAPFCEQATAVTTPMPHPTGPSDPANMPAGFATSNLWSHAGVWELEEVRAPNLNEPGHNAAEVVLWERYAVTRASAGGQWAGQPEQTNELLFGPEPHTRVRHIDGYARTSFTTRLHDAITELERNGMRPGPNEPPTAPLDFLGDDVGNPLWDPADDDETDEFHDLLEAALDSTPVTPEPIGGILVETGTVHDLVDMDGDGYPDRVLGGAGILMNYWGATQGQPLPHATEANGNELAVRRQSPFAPKDQILSTEEMTWMVARFDPETGEFGSMTPWPMSYDHPVLMGPPPAPAAIDPAWGDPRHWREHHHLSWLSIWESTIESGAPAPTGYGSASTGMEGVSVGAGFSLGPLSASFGGTAGYGGYSPAVEHGPGLWTEFVTDQEFCGLTDLGPGCPPAAEGQASQSVDPRGLRSYVEYDEVGRPARSWDDLSTAPLDETVTSYERFVRGPSRDLFDEPGLPATRTRLSPVGDDDLPAQVSATSWFDGMGRVLLTRSRWVSDEGAPGQRVDGWVLRDERDRVARGWLPCFSSSSGSSQVDWPLGGFDPAQDCAVEPASETFVYNSYDQVLLHQRPDDSLLYSQRYLAGGDVQGEAVFTRLLDASGSLLRRAETAVGPFRKTETRFDAETFEFQPAPPGEIPTTLSPGSEVLQTVELFDPLGRRAEVTRTGTLAGVDETVFLWDGLGRLVEYEDADQGLWTFAYDAAGRLELRQSLARATMFPSHTTLFTYDAQSRVTEEEHRDGGLSAIAVDLWEFDYDRYFLAQPARVETAAIAVVPPVGLPTETRHSGLPFCPLTPTALSLDTQLAWFYDARGRVIEQQQELFGCEWDVDTGGNLFATFEYFQDGEVSRYFTPTSTTVPIDGRKVVDTLRNDAGQATALTFDSEPIVTHATYDPFGRLRVLSLGNGTEQINEYATGISSDQALVRSTVTSGSVPIFDRHYLWDAAGDLLQWEDVAPRYSAGQGEAELATCRYDGLGVLQQCTIEREGPPGSPIGPWVSEGSQGSGPAPQGTPSGNPGNGPSGNGPTPFTADPPPGQAHIPPGQGGGGGNGGGGTHTYELRYRYDVLGNLLQEEIDLLGIHRSAWQHHPGDRQLLPSVEILGYIAPQNGTVARVEQVSQPASRELVLNQRFDPRGNLVHQSYQPYDGSLSYTGNELGFDAGQELATRDLEWSGRGKLSRVLTNSTGLDDLASAYWYDAGGDRIGKVVYDAQGEQIGTRRFGGLLETTLRPDMSWDRADLLRFNGKLVAQSEIDVLGSPEAPNELLRYVAGDHLGSATVVTDELGLLVHGIRYEPYGRVREQWGGERALEEYERGELDERFNGKQRDVLAYGLAGTDFELEGYDYGARIYLPGLSSWASADSITPDFTWEANHYAYVRGNPLKYRDPEGTQSLVSDKDLSEEEERAARQAQIDEPWERFWEGGDPEFLRETLEALDKATSIMGLAGALKGVAGRVLFKSPLKKKVVQEAVEGGATRPNLAKRIWARVTGRAAAGGGGPIEAGGAPTLNNLGRQLPAEEAAGAFTASGALSPTALRSAEQIFAPGTLGNPAIPQGFGKYTTQTFRSPAGPFQVHFYMNPTTGEVFYGLDYKAVFNNGITTYTPGGP